MTELETLQAITALLQTLINLGVWLLRICCIGLGLMAFRFITLRSPV